MFGYWWDGQYIALLEISKKGNRAIYEVAAWIASDELELTLSIFNSGSKVFSVNQHTMRLAIPSFGAKLTVTMTQTATSEKWTWLCV